MSPEENNFGYLKNNYLLPSTKHILEQEARKEAYRFLDKFSRYKQVEVALEDQHKIAFATKFGVFSDYKMPFSLTNAKTKL